MASKYKKNNVKFKWTKELIILIVALLAIIGTTIALSVPSAKEKTTKSLNEAIVLANAENSTGNSYSTLPNKNVYRDITHEKLIKKLSQEEYVYVLYGSTNNAVFLQYLSKINSTATAEEIETVYIYSSKWVEETENTETATFKEKKSALEDELNANKSADVDKFDLLTYPALLVYKDGKLIFNSQTYTDSNSNWDMYIQKAFYLAKEKEANK